MKGLKKLALASAVAAAPFAQAELTAMDDALLEEMTGQAGLTIDVDLNMSIAEIRYTDEDGFGTDIGDGGFLNLTNLVISGDQGAANNQALIRGVTIDVDNGANGSAADGIVIGFGQIGGLSSAAQNPADTDLVAADPRFAAMAGAGVTGLDTASGAQVAALTSNYWTGVNVTADFGINGVKAGSVAVKNFTNFVPNALAVEGVQKFGYTFDGVGGPRIALTNDDASSTNLTAIGSAISAGGSIETTYATLRAAPALAGQSDQAVYDLAKAQVVADDASGFATALAAGNYVDAWVSIAAGGADDGDAAGTTEGLSIQAAIGFVIEEMSYTDDGRKMGFHNFTMFDTDDTTGEITAFMVSDLKIDVVERVADANSSATAALQISGLNTQGTIAIGDIFIGDHENGSIGAVAIRDIDMSNTAIRIYGH